MSVVRAATAADTDAIVDTLVEAFATDPFVSWIVRPDAPERARQRYMRIALERMTLPHGHVYTTDGCASVALWSPPGAWELGVGDQLALLPSVARIVGLSRFGTIARALSALEASRPPGPWWFLVLLGTRPDARGRGLASAVLEPVLARCDRDGVRAILDTCVERNVRFYSRHGFAVHAESRLRDGPPCWSMVREPRA